MPVRDSRRHVGKRRQNTLAGSCFFALLLCLLSARLLASDGGLRLSTFDIDATPPVGSFVAYSPQVKATWDLGLRAKGVVLLGAGEPIVLCAIDWIGISNEGMDDFRNATAAAAGTNPQRVSVHAVHQHDAPRYDSGAERILLEAGIDPGVMNPTHFDGTFPRDVLRRLTTAVRSSLADTRPVTHIGLGSAEVERVASNRSIYGPDGKVRATRMSATLDPALRAEPEGLIDPEVSLVSFWNEEKPLAVLSYYATHPQSYYRTGVPNPDFVGVARFFRQMEVPDPLHIHFNGAGGNVAASKYNDGAPENRLALANRLADGMKRAWEATQRTLVAATDVQWISTPVALPPAAHLYGMQALLGADNAVLLENNGNARKMAWLARSQAGKTIDIGCLAVSQARILHLPGEVFVEYQLAAKDARPDLFVAVAAYSDMAPGYIGTALAYEKGGYEVSERTSNVSPDAERVLMDAIRKLLEE